jgi:hypothetical protein
VVTSLAPPLRVQPVPSNESTLWPGASVYQLESFSEENGWENE